MLHGSIEGAAAKPFTDGTGQFADPVAPSTSELFFRLRIGGLRPEAFGGVRRVGCQSVELHAGRGFGGEGGSIAGRLPARRSLTQASHPLGDRDRAAMLSHGIPCLAGAEVI